MGNTLSKCSVCGGELISDYRAGICRCGYCGNKWELSETDPDFAQYGALISQLNKADSLAAGRTSLKQTEEAIMLYKSIQMSCSSSKPSEAMNAIRDICKKAAEECVQQKKYITALEHKQNGAYSKALKEFTELGAFGDSANQAEECLAGVKEERIKRIPYCVAVGLILPALLFFFLKEKADIGLVSAGLIFALAAAADIFVIYLNNGFSTAVEVISFIVLIPLLLFAFLAYILHISPALSAGLAVGVPIVIIILAVVMGEK